MDFSKENSIQKIVKWVLENSVLVMELRAMIKLEIISFMIYLRYGANYQGIMGYNLHDFTMPTLDGKPIVN
jgi:hypothetical protein